MARVPTVTRGTVLGRRYELVDEIGRGGHGTVYRALQRPLGRAVAVKVLRPDADPAGAQRFAREISLVQRLEHPNTVRLYDFGTNRDGLPYIVFELLRGRALDTEIERAPLSPSRVAKIATQILKSLMEAHALGIVHRDVKPANVLLVDYSGEPDFVKVLDFGVARRVTPSLERTITGHGQMIGTPAYMAPEQVREGELGPHTDLYAVGLLMAEALSGRPVFAGSDGAVWIAQASDKPVPLPPYVRGSVLGAVIARATRKDPAERYASAADMIADIERATTDALLPPTDPFSATQPVDPRDLTPPPVVARWRDTRPKPAEPPPSRLRSAALLAAGALAAMLALHVGLRAEQLREEVRREPEARVSALSPRPLLLRDLGWKIDKVYANTQRGVRAEGYTARRALPGDKVEVANVYLAEYPNAVEAKTFASFMLANSPTVAVRQDERMVVWVSAKDPKSAEDLLSAVLR
jgi:serine/threonine protein kinase